MLSFSPGAVAVTFDFRLNERRRNHDRRQSVVSPEQLEARLLLSTTSVTSGSLPIVSNLATGSPVVLSRSVTATSSADSADEFTITGTSASLSIQGVSSTTSVALTYAWTTTQAPSGGAISYSKNSTNQAKDNTLTFTRAGAYVTKVSILSGKTVVSTLMLQLSVTPLPTRVGLLDGSNRTVNSGAVLSVTTAPPKLLAIVIDQFNQPLLTQPEIAWSVVATPAGGSATLTATGNSLATVVGKAGTYTLKAGAGSQVATVSFNVSQVITSVTLGTLNGAVVDSSQPLVTRASTQAVVVKCFDQFGNKMSSQPSITWSTLSAPSGGTASVRFSSGIATATFTRAGMYVIKGVAGSQVFTFQVSAEATLTRISVRTPENREVVSGGTVSVSGTSYQLSTVGLDQFGQPLLSPPEIAWRVITSVSGGTATLTTEGNKVLATVNKAGSYSLRATSGTILSNVTLNIAQVLTSLKVSTPDGSAVDSSVPVVTKTTSQQIAIKGFDQFSNAMSSQPSITWSTLSAPSGGTSSVRLSSGVATVTFTRAGVYVIKGVTGNQVFTVQINAEATLSRVSVRTPENREVLSGGTVSASGTSYQLNAIALDQFSQPMLTPPEISWQVITSASGGTANLTTEGNKVVAAVNKAGSYSLRATSGSILSNVTLSVAQVLTSLAVSAPDGSVVDPSVPVVTKTTSQQIAIKGLDQFGNVMSSQPSITWSTLSAPSGGTASVRFSSGIATATLTRAGLYVIKGVTGGQVFTFQINAEATLTRISVRTPENREVVSGGTISISGAGYQLSTIALDQFAQPMVTPPEITWQVITSVSGGTATLTTEGNNLLAAVSKAGSYSLRATSGSIMSNVTLSVAQVLTTLRLATTDGTVVDPTVPVSVSTTTSRLAVQTLDQFENPLTSLPSISWSTVLAPSGGTASTVFSSGIATVTFNRSGDYVVRATSGAFTVTAGFQVVPTLQSIAAFGSDGRQLSTTAITVGAINSVVTLTGLDQFRVALAEQPEFSWSEVTTPSGGTASFSNTGSSHTITFSKAGSYTLQTNVDTLSLNLTFSVVQTLTNITLTPGNLTISYGVTQQFLASALDQFESPFIIQPAFLWSATGGTISNTGVYSAGTQAGSYSVNAKVGTFVATMPITVIAPTIPDGLLDPDLAVLVNGYYGDGLIDRTDMMAILRSAGVDGMVSATELADFRFLVSSTTPYTMPEHVRGLATDVVNTSPANLRYKDQTAGNLSAGSSSTLLNNLVDKWFLGTDEPALTTPMLTYQTTTGNLFNGTPSRADARQGALGDCYFIAAVASIADSNPDAVRNMFVDNGDGTYTVRFYSVHDGTADYVTVSRRLPAQYNGALGYSGYGLSVSSASTTVWIALAEKAYAQWNETGNEGRDGTNRYAAIEGGWMGYVNAQVLGTESSNYSLASYNKQTLITALSTQKAVTIGTNSSVSAGLYGSHAYLVTGYEASTDTFRLHNPWGFSHPGALSYSQLQAYCSVFVVADASGSSPISGSVSGAISDPHPAAAGFASSHAVQNSSMVELDGASAEHQRDYSIAQVAAESSAESELRSDGISPRVLTRLRINFMNGNSVESDLWNVNLPKDHLTELEFDLIDRLFAEQDEPITT
jgi:sorbitol-specific phosphotransferase system component IIA